MQTGSGSAWTRHRLVRYALVGAAATLVDAGLFGVLTAVGAGPAAWRSAACSAAAAAAAYPAHARLTFGARLTWAAARRFVGVNLATIALGTAWVAVVGPWLSAHHLGAAAAALLAKGSAILLTASVNYGLYRRAVFPQPSAGAARPRRGGGPVSLSIVMPARDEAARLPVGLADLIGWQAAWPGPLEVLVVDDGSRDGTVAVAEAFRGRVRGLRVLRRPRLGKGAAVRAGILASRGTLVALLDADGSLPAAALSRLAAAWRDGADAVCGRRGQGGAGLALWRPWASAAWRALVRAVCGGGWRDPQCGVKLWHGALARRLAGAMRLDGFAADAEWLWRLRRARARLAEVDVPFVPRPGSKVRPLVAAPAMLGGLAQVAAWRVGRRRAGLVGIAAVVGLAAALRLPHYLSVPAFTDEWQEVAVAQQVLRGAWPLHNASADGGPVWNYLLAAEFALFGPRLWLPRLTATLASVATVALTALLGRKLWGGGAAIAAGVAVAASAVGVVLGHIAWSEELAPLAVLAAAWATLSAMRGGTARHVLAGLAWGVALQTHAGVAAFVPGLEVWLWRRQRAGRVRVADLAAGHAAAAVASANLWLYNLMTGGGSLAWAERHQRYAFAPTADPAVYGTRLAAMTGDWLRALASAGSVERASPGAEWPLTLAAGALVALGIAAALRRRPWGGAALLACLVVSAVVVIPAVCRYERWYVAVRYLWPAAPLAAVLAARSAAAAVRRAGRALRDRPWRRLPATLSTALLAAAVVHGATALDRFEARAAGAGRVGWVVARLVARRDAVVRRPILVDARAPGATVLPAFLQVAGWPTRVLGNPWAAHGKGDFAPGAWRGLGVPALALVSAADWPRVRRLTGARPLQRLRGGLVMAAIPSRPRRDVGFGHRATALDSG